MQTVQWLTAKDVVKVNAVKWPTRIAVKDLYRSYTFKQWNDRACRLANALADMGMKKGDRFAVLAYNCVEWMEIYAAAAKGGFICLPLMLGLPHRRWNTTSTTANARSSSFREAKTGPTERSSPGSVR
jgi:acyl-CoA synthetase (AMP-forming)/AMP-acid ligase II